MKKLVLATAFSAIALPALAGYGGGYHHAPVYAAPRVVCHIERVFVPGYYGGHYVLRKVCRTVSFGY
jgi:hypothetical protein